MSHEYNESNDAGISGSPHLGVVGGMEGTEPELGLVGSGGGASPSVGGRNASIGFAAERARARRARESGLPPGMQRSVTEAGHLRGRTSMPDAAKRDRRISGESSESDFVAGLGNQEELRQEQEREEKAAMAGAADIPIALVSGAGGRGQSGAGGNTPTGVAGALNAALGLGISTQAQQQGADISALVNPDGARSDVEVTSSSDSSDGSSASTGSTGSGS